MQRIKTIFRKAPTWVKKILLCIVLVMCILPPIKNNLRKYSLYYAQHIPHKDGVYPEINLQWLFNLKYEKTFDGKDDWKNLSIRFYPWTFLENPTKKTNLDRGLFFKFLS